MRWVVAAHSEPKIPYAVLLHPTVEEVLPYKIPVCGEVFVQHLFQIAPSYPVLVTVSFVKRISCSPLVELEKIHRLPILDNGLAHEIAVPTNSPYRLIESQQRRILKMRWMAEISVRSVLGKIGNEISCVLGWQREIQILDRFDAVQRHLCVVTYIFGGGSIVDQDRLEVLLQRLQRAPPELLIELSPISDTGQNVVLIRRITKRSVREIIDQGTVVYHAFYTPLTPLSTRGHGMEAKPKCSRRRRDLHC